MKTQTIKNVRAAFLQCEKGQAIAEYTMMAMVLLVLLFIMTAVGTNVKDAFVWISNNIF
jgi:Flp pilus assembly pilin Flp